MLIEGHYCSRGGTDLDSFEQIDRNSRVMRDGRPDDVPMADYRYVLIRVAQPQVFHSANDSCLHIQHQFASRRCGAAAQQVEAPPGELMLDVQARIVRAMENQH